MRAKDDLIGSGCLVPNMLFFRNDWFFPHSENVPPFFVSSQEKHTNQALMITPKMAFGTSQALKLCRVFVVWEKNQGKVAFTCLNPLDGTGKNGLISGKTIFWTPKIFRNGSNWAILGWVCSLKVSSLVSKDGRRYSYSHQKQGESQKPSFSSIMPHDIYIYIPFFSCERFSQSQNGGEETSIVMLEVFWDSWASAVWIWNWLCGKIVSLLKIWTYKIGPPDPIINGIITTLY